MDINVGGATYPQWSDALTWLVANPQIVDVDLVQIADINQNDAFVAGTNVIGTTTLSFAIKNGTWHKGNPNQGYKTYFGPDGVINLNIQGSGTVIFEKLWFDSHVFTPNIVTPRIAAQKGMASDESTFVYRDLLMKGNRGLGGFGDTLLSPQGNYAPYLRVSNVKIWNAGNVGLALDVNGYNNPDYTGRRVVENSTVYGCQNVNIRAEALVNKFNHQLNNVVAFDCVTDDWAYDALLNVYNNCADGDGTLAEGANILNNITPADEFESLDDTNDRFLFLKLGAVTADWTREPAGDVFVGDVIKFDPEVTLTPGAANLGNSGIAPTLESTDITGQSIPKIENEYPIGCHVQEYST